jgi:hypothetical protein
MADEKLETATRLPRRRTRRPRGWTLVELGVVFIVVAIIVGVTGPKLVGFMEGAQAEAVEKEVLALVEIVHAFGLNALGPDAEIIAYTVPTTDGSTLPGGLRYPSGGGLGIPPALITNDLARLMPGFDGLSAYEQPFEFTIQSFGRDNIQTPFMLMSTCVPEDDFPLDIWVPLHASLFIDRSTCGDACGTAGTEKWCALSYRANILAPRNVSSESAENEQTFEDFPLPPPAFLPGGTSAPPPPPPK